MSRTKLTVLAIALIVIILAGTGYYYTVYQTQVQQQAALEATRKTLVLGTTDQIQRGIDPCTGISPAEATVSYQIMEPLYTEASNGTITPRLASDFPTVSTDGLAWTIPLRHDVKFTDGTPFNATAVKSSFDRCINLKGPTWDIWYGQVASVEVVDTYTARIHLSAPYGPYLQVLASAFIGIVSPSALLNMGETAFESAPVGSGPFEFVSWTRGQQVILQANKDYWGTMPKVDKVIVETFQDSATLKLALEQGDVDIALAGIAPIDMQSLRNEASIVTLEAPGVFQQYLSFNTRKIPADVRHAVAYAINYTDLLNRVYLGSGQRALSILPPPFLAYEPVLSTYQFDPNKAMQLLAPLGITPATPLQLEFLTTTTHYGPLDDPAAVVIKADLAAVGIDLNIKTVDWATFIDLWSSGSYQMLMGGWWPDWPDPDSLVYNMLRSDTYAGKWAGYNSSQMDSLTAEGRGISDLTSPQRIQIYHQIQELYAQDLPMLEYVNVKQVVFTRSDVHGFVVNFIPMLVDLTPVYKD